MGDPPDLLQDTSNLAVLEPWPWQAHAIDRTGPIVAASQQQAR